MVYSYFFYKWIFRDWPEEQPPWTEVVRGEGQPTRGRGPSLKFLSSAHLGTARRQGQCLGNWLKSQKAAFPAWMPSSACSLVYRQLP